MFKKTLNKCYELLLRAMNSPVGFETPFYITLVPLLR